MPPVIQLSMEFGTRGCHVIEGPSLLNEAWKLVSAILLQWWNFKCKDNIVFWMQMWSQQRETRPHLIDLQCICCPCCCPLSLSLPWLPRHLSVALTFLMQLMNYVNVIWTGQHHVGQVHSSFAHLPPLLYHKEPLASFDKYFEIVGWRVQPRHKVLHACSFRCL